MKKIKIIYWVSTLLVCIPLIINSVMGLSKNKDMCEEMTQLGYPLYFMTALAIAQLSG